MSLGKIKLFSVPGAGTIFLKNLLDDHGFSVNATHYGDRCPQGFIISPIRNPSDVYKTWANIRPEQLASFDQMWDCFNRTYIANPDLFILPIDTPDRHEYLNKLSERLGKKLNTEWTAVNSRSSKESISPSIDNVAKLSVVKKFYGVPG